MFVFVFVPVCVPVSVCVCVCRYHANNEYALLSDFKKGYKVLCRLIELFNQ